MKYIPKDDWQPIDNIKLEDAAKDLIYSNQNAIVIAGPGAGKTELLAQKACYLLQTNTCKYPKRILAISYKKDAASNLLKRVQKRCGSELSMRLHSMTFDAFCKRILDQYNYALPKHLQVSFPYRIGDDKVTNSAYEKLNLGRKEYHKALPENEESQQLWSLLLRGDDEDSPILTYNMIRMLALHIVRTNSMIRRVIQRTYSNVFLDEFQDTTLIQYELVKECFKDSDCLLIAVGDNKQQIMTWAGAEKNIFSIYKMDFQAKETHLSRNYRSNDTIDEFLKDFFEDLREKSLASSTTLPKERPITLCFFNDVYQEARVVADDILSRVNGGISAENICILCRRKEDDYTKTLKEELIKRGIIARKVVDYENSKSHLLVQRLLTLIQTCIEKSKSTAIIELVEWVKSTRLRSSTSNDKKNTHYIYEFHQQLDDIGKALRLCTNKTDFRKIMDKSKALLFSVNDKEFNAPYSQEDVVEEILDRFSQLMYGDEEECTIQDALDNFLGKDIIPIMTIHKSKGLEYDSIYIIGLEDRAFYNFKKKSDEEKKVLFVAASRAKNRIIITHCQKRGFTGETKDIHQDIEEAFTIFSDRRYALVKDYTADW